MAEKHECIKEEFLGKVAEFMENTKGFKVTLFTISLAIIIQVGAFLYLWGGLVATVNNHDKSIEKILAKFDKIKIVYAIGESNGK